MKNVRRFLAAFVCMALVGPLCVDRAVPMPSRTRVQYNPYHWNAGTPHRYLLPGGRYFVVARNGLGTLYDAHHRIAGMRWVPANALPQGSPDSGSYKAQLNVLLTYLSRRQAKVPYAQDHIVVVFRDGAGPSQDTFAVPRNAMKTAMKGRTYSATSVVPHYTNDVRINSIFARFGVSREQRLFAGISRSELGARLSIAQSKLHRPLLNAANAYSVNLGGASILKAVQALRTEPNVAYAAPDWTVTPTNPLPRALPEAEITAMRQANAGAIREATMRRTASAVSTVEVPQNFSVASSLQSVLNASNLDVLSAYQEIEQQFHQLPGTGETITNVSVGDVVSAEDVPSTVSPTNDCAYIQTLEGPTTHTIGGQRYIDWPGLPLIPAYAADASGHTDPSYYACGVGSDSEIGLDFSMMAPLPDGMQRPSEQSSRALGDLFGIAPGANYRLFVPASNGPSNPNSLSTLDGVLLAAANASPKTDIITASLGFGYDFQGFPGRYLEDDPLTEALIATIVNAYGIVVCISANDGMRTVTPVSIGPSGGSAATNVTSDLTQTTNLNDLGFTTLPSLDVDSGAIDVGGTTLNDILARPITDPSDPGALTQVPYPETRYDGGQYLSSGFGSRVNVSAPADNVLALDKDRLTYDGVDAFSEGGTSASAPEVAAVAAVIMQVAKLTGHPLTSPADVRSFLVSTGTPVAQTPQTDQPLNVGPQVDLRRGVEQLFKAGGIQLHAAVSRVAIAQRRVAAPLDTFGAIYYTNTDPTNINLEGTDYGDGNGPDGSGITDPITIAPDWQGIPEGSSYSLFIAGHPDKVLASTPFVRLMPETILSAAGLPLVSSSTRTVHLTYRAGVGLHALAQTSFDLTFGPTDGTSVPAPPPSVPAVVTAQSFPVTYDVSKARTMRSNLMLVVTEPGRFAASDGWVIHMVYAQPLTNQSGTVSVPVSALQGGGLYGVAIMSTDPVSGRQYISDQATTRVQQGATARAPAPLVQVAGSNVPYAHILEFPFSASVNVKWDVSSVPNATGALLEVSAPGPSVVYVMNTFNNPNGTVQDNDGVNTGSVKVIPLAESGTRTFTAEDLGLHSAMLQQIRVIPVNGIAPVGEASDVSTMITDGITGSFGGYLDYTPDPYAGGFAIDPNGTDGFVADSAALPFEMQTGIDLFDQTTGQSSSALSTASAGPDGLRGGGYYGGGVGFFAEDAHVGDAIGARYDTISTTVQGPQFDAPVTLPSQNDQIIQTSYSPESTRMAYLYTDSTQTYGSISPQLRTYDFSSGTFGPALTTPISSGFNSNGIVLFNADIPLNKAVIARQDGTDWTGAVPSYFDVVDLTTGATSEYPSQAAGLASAMAVDPTTHVAMAVSAADDAVVLFNIQTGMQQKVSLPDAAAAASIGENGGLSLFDADQIGVDPVNHLFLVFTLLGANAINADYNATSVLYVYDESGNLVKTINGWAWNSQSDIIDNARQYLQANGNTRKAYLMMGSQIAVIDY